MSMRIGLLVLLVAMVLPLGFIAANIQSTPLVAARSGGTAADAKRTRELYREFRRLTEVDDGPREMTFSEREINSALLFAARAVPGVRGQASIFPGTVDVRLSARIPLGGWLNAAAEVGSSERGLNLLSVQFGRMSLPPELTLQATRLLLDVSLGDSAGTLALNALGRVTVADDTVTVEVVMKRADRKRLAKSAKGTARNLSGLSSEEEVRAYWVALTNAIASGEISRSTGFPGVLAHALTLVSDRNLAGDEHKKDVQAALLALAVACGHDKFQGLTGEFLTDAERRARHPCHGYALAGRGDLRAHFAISAGLHAAADAGAAFAIGEFKELLDSNEGGSGFSFDDIAADMAGINLAKIALSTPDHFALSRLAASIRNDQAILPNTADLPSNMTESEFKHRFGKVDSPRYKDMLKTIESRLAQLPASAY